MTAATKIQWRVQTKASTGRWINRGLYETRSAARADAWSYRECGKFPDGEPLGFGNTRVIRYVKGSK